MRPRNIIGIVIFGASVGFIVYLYKGFLKPRMEVDAEIKSGKTPPPTTSTTPPITTKK